MVEPKYDQEALAVIGGIIIQWGAIEKQIAQAVQQIEMQLALFANVWPPKYTDLQALRSFKERKGHLRTLVQRHGSKAALGALDNVYRKMKEPALVRHSLGHDIINIGPTPKDGSAQWVCILDLGNVARRKMPETEWRTVEDLKTILYQLPSLHMEVMEAAWIVVGALMTARKRRQAP